LFPESAETVRVAIDGSDTEASFDQGPAPLR
jgi:hypothetical protein